MTSRVGSVRVLLFVGGGRALRAVWANAGLTASPRWRVVVLHYMARALGILVHVEGFPFGSRRNLPGVRGFSGAKRPNMARGPNLDPHGSGGT